MLLFAYPANQHGWTTLGPLEKTHESFYKGPSGGKDKIDFYTDWKSSLKRLINLLMVSSFLLLTLSGRRYLASSWLGRYQEPFHQATTTNRVNLPRSGLLEQGAPPDAKTAAAFGRAPCRQVTLVVRLKKLGLCSILRHCMWKDFFA